MSSKKRMWSEEEIENEVTVSMFAGIILSVSLTIIILMFFYTLYVPKGEWQPINCVNETKTETRYVMGCDWHNDNSSGFNISYCLGS